MCVYKPTDERDLAAAASEWKQVGDEGTEGRDVLCSGLADQHHLAAPRPGRHRHGDSFVFTALFSWAVTATH